MDDPPFTRACKMLWERQGPDIILLAETMFNPNPRISAWTSKALTPFHETRGGSADLSAMGGFGQNF
jgi:hypothetical protein